MAFPDFSMLGGAQAVDGLANVMPSYTGNTDFMASTTAGLNGGMGGAPGGGLLGGASPIGAGLAGLQTLGALWGAWQQNKMAKKQFKFTKDITNTNLANQIKSYNTALFDRARSRAAMEGQTPEQMNAYINNNSLSRSATGSHKTDAYTHNYGNASAAPVLAGSMGSLVASAGGSTPSLSGMGAALASRAAASRASSERDDETSGS